MNATAQRAAAERSKTWWLLASLLLDPPSAASVGELHAALNATAMRSPPLQTLRDAAAAALANPHALVDLQVDFAKLLRGVDGKHGPIEPYESLAREGHLFGATTDAVVAAYREAGFADISPEAGPPDHAGTELRFMSLLCLREMEAWQANDAAAAATWQDRQERFVEEHLAQWLPAHCGHLQHAAATAFYRAVAMIVGEACGADAHGLERAGA